MLLQQQLFFSSSKLVKISQSLVVMRIHCKHLLLSELVDKMKAAEAGLSLSLVL